MKPRDITNKRFGKLVAIKLLPERYKGRTVWECKCDCGNISNVTQHDLASGETKSCGCIKRNILGDTVRLESGRSAFNQLYGNYKRQSNNRGYNFSLTKDEFFDITKKSCYYCGREPYQIQIVKGGFGTYIYNGIDRVNNFLGYTLDNCVPCCGICNHAKDIMSKEDFLSWIKLVYEKTLDNS